MLVLRDPPVFPMLNKSSFSCQPHGTCARSMGPLDADDSPILEVDVESSGLCKYLGQNVFVVVARSVQ